MKVPSNTLMNPIENLMVADVGGPLCISAEVECLEWDPVAAQRRAAMMDDRPANRRQRELILKRTCWVDLTIGYVQLARAEV